MYIQILVKISFGKHFETSIFTKYSLKSNEENNSILKTI